MQVSRLTLDEPRYTYAESDRIAAVTRGTSKRWLKGYQYATPEGRIVLRPPVSTTPAVEPGVSFHELIEVAAIGRLKDLGLSLHEIRALVETAHSMFDVDRPLVSLRFKVGGRDVFVEDADGSLVEISRPNRRRAWDHVLAPFLATVDYDGGEVATRWWPMGREHPVFVDPDYGFGQPVIAGSGVRTEIIWEQFLAGSSRDQVADDFGIDPVLVEDAIKFEASRAESVATAGS